MIHYATLVVSPEISQEQTAAAAAAAKLFQSCPTLCDPIDGSPPGSSIPGILQARTLEWVAIDFSTQADDMSLYSRVGLTEAYYVKLCFVYKNFNF